ncbi:MAG: SGNH/GDSL hydrolase family protein [Bacteroidota bacterium]
MASFFYSLTRTVVLLLWLSSSLYAQDIDQWDKEMAAFKEADSLQAPTKGGIVFTGSSSIRLWQHLKEQFPDHHIINRGFGGSQLEDVIALADQIIYPYAPRQVVIYAGDNDLASGKLAEEVAGDFELLFLKIRDRLPAVNIIFLSIKPSPSRSQYLPEIRKTNQLISQFLKKKRKAAYVDVFSGMLGTDGKPRAELFKADSLHINAKGYQEWAALLSKHLIK